LSECSTVARTVSVDTSFCSSAGPGRHELARPRRGRSSSHEDHAVRLIGSQDPQLVVEIEARHGRHHQIAEDQVEAFAALKERQRVSAARDDGRVVLADPAADRAAEHRFVVDDESARLCRGEPGRFRHGLRVNRRACRAGDLAAVPERRGREPAQPPGAPSPSASTISPPTVGPFSYGTASRRIYPLRSTD
jgi:hypothetical protein